MKSTSTTTSQQSTAHGKLLMTILQAVAECQSECHSEATKAGIKAARQRRGKPTSAAVYMRSGSTSRVVLLPAAASRKGGRDD